MSDLSNLFEETEVPSGAGRPPRIENPFPPAIAKLKELNESRKDGDKPKALQFDLKHLTITDDDDETMERVTNRARRYLTQAGDQLNVSVEMRAGDKPGTIKFWVVPSRKRGSKNATEKAPEVSADDKTADKK